MTPAWLATFVRRWHTNPDLCHTVDPVGWHSSRMAILALEIWPDCSRDLLVACLCHDLGESVTGDIPWGAKQDDALKDASVRLEGDALAKMGMENWVFGEDCARLKYLDRLDAYLWAKHHATHVLARDDWKECLAWLQAETDNLGIEGIIL